MAVRRMPVKDPVKIKYIGPASVMNQNVYPGPVSGNGYYAKPGQVIEIESVDYDTMVNTNLWSPVLSKRGKPLKMKEEVSE